MNVLFLANPIVPQTPNTEYDDIESQIVSTKVSSKFQEKGIVKTALENIGKYFITIHPKKYSIRVVNEYGYVRDFPFSKVYEYMRIFSNMNEMESIAFDAIRYRHRANPENNKLEMIEEFANMIIAFIDALSGLTEHQMHDREILNMADKVVEFYGYNKQMSPNTHYSAMLMRTTNLLFAINV